MAAAAVVSRKRAFETPDTAPYRTSVAPRLDAELGRPADPRRLAPPTESALPGAPAIVPTTSQSNKNTNVSIPYARVARDPTNLGAVGTPVVVRARYEGANIEANRHRSVPELRCDTVAGVDAVNRELATREVDNSSWRLDGILMSTEQEMDPKFREQVENEAFTTTTSVLVAIQGPTVLRNLYCSRPLVGDFVYLGLVYSLTGDPAELVPQWVPFSSQHLDMAFVPERPRAPQLGFAGIVNRKLEHVEFTDTQIRLMCRAYCIGRVVDCAPSPGMITVNVQVRLMESDELGRRHDEANTITRTYMEGDEQKQKIYYTGRIGSECPTELIGELGGEFGGELGGEPGGEPGGELGGEPSGELGGTFGKGFEPRPPDAETFEDDVDEEETVARVVSSATETVRALGPDVEDGEGDENYRKLFNDSYGSIEAVFEEFARKKNLSFEDPDTMDELLSAGNEMASSPAARGDPYAVAAAKRAQRANAGRKDAFDEVSKLRQEGRFANLDAIYVRGMAFAVSLVAAVLQAKVLSDWDRRVSDLEKEAYDEFLVAVDEFLEYVDRKRELAVDKQERPIAEIALWALRYDLRQSEASEAADTVLFGKKDALDVILRLSIVADAVRMLVLKYLNVGNAALYRA